MRITQSKWPSRMRLRMLVASESSCPPRATGVPGYALGYNNRDQMIEGLLPDGNFTLEAASFGPNAASGQLNISVKGAAVEGPRMTLVPNGAISVNVQEEFTSNENTSSEPRQSFTGAWSEAKRLCASGAGR